MKRRLIQVMAGLTATTLLCTTSFAGMKVKGDMAEIETVAVVGYSFLRDVQMEEASITKLTRKEIPLTEDEPEYQMMQDADDWTMEVLQGFGTFTIMPREEVLANDVYVSETKDPEKKLNMSWYFPKGYRDIKLKKKTAVKLCEALGVDAVVLLEFDSRSTEKSSSWGVVYTKSERAGDLEGAITMFDSSGKELISGEIKTDKTTRSTSHGWGNEEGMGRVNKEFEAENIDSIWYAMLYDYLTALDAELNPQ